MKRFLIKGYDIILTMAIGFILNTNWRRVETVFMKIVIVVMWLGLAATLTYGFIDLYNTTPIKK